MINFSPKILIFINICSAGDVNIKSDYFSLSVMLFNALTNVHPYKGICKTIPKISDRMINKKSIINSTDVIIPKCYEPVTNQHLSKQFEDIFNLGNRFIIDLKNKTQNTIVNNTKQIVNVVVKSDNLIIHTVLNDNIIATYCSKDILVVINNNNQLISFDVSLKGNFTKLSTKENFNNKDKIFVYKKDIYCLRNNILFNVSSCDKIFEFTTNSKLKSNQYDNIIVIISDDTMYRFDLNNTYNGIIGYETISVFGGKFVNYNGLFQNVSDNSVLFYQNSGLNSSIVKTKIKDIIQNGNYGIIEVVENERILYKLFSIKNLHTTLFDTDYISFRYFGVLNEQTLVIPADDKLMLIRTEDMNSIVEFTCHDISENTIIHCSNAGIVAVNGDSIKLINKK